MISASVARFIMFIQIVSTFALVLALCYLFAIWLQRPWDQLAGAAAFQSFVFAHLVPILTLLLGLMGFCAARLLQWFEFDPQPLTTIRPAQLDANPKDPEPKKKPQRRPAPGWFKGPNQPM